MGVGAETQIAGRWRLVDRRYRSREKGTEERGSGQRWQVPDCEIVPRGQGLEERERVKVRKRQTRRRYLL